MCVLIDIMIINVLALNNYKQRIAHYEKHVMLLYTLSHLEAF